LDVKAARRTKIIGIKANYFKVDIDMTKFRRKLAVACLAATTLLMLESGVNGQNWTGAVGDGLWSNGANWSGGVPADGTSDITISGTTTRQDVNADMASPLVIGAIGSGGFREFIVSSGSNAGGLGVDISGQTFDWVNARLRISGENNSFSNDWILSNTLTLIVQPNANSVGPLAISGDVTGSGGMNVQAPIAITGNYSATGFMSFNGTNVANGSLILDGTISSAANSISFSNSTLRGGGTINRDVTIGSSSSAVFGSLDQASTLTFNAGLQFGSSSSRGNRRVSIQNNVAANGSVLVSGDGSVGQSASLSGTGDISFAANARFWNDGLISGGRTIFIGRDAEFFGATGGVVAAGVDVQVNGGELNSGNTFNGQVSMLGGGRISGGVFNASVFANAGEIGRFGNNDTTTFNSDLNLFGSVQISSELIEGTGTINVGAVGDSAVATITNVNVPTQFSNTINWNVTESSVGGLGQAAAGTFLGNNVQLNSGTLNGNDTNYVVAGNLNSSGTSTLNQSVTVNGDTTVDSGTLTIAGGRTLNASNLVLNNAGTLINNGTLGTGNIVLESALLGGNVDVSNGLVVRTSGTSEITSGSSVEVVGLTEVQAGTLQVASGATLSGTGGLEIDSLATVDLQGAIVKDVTVLSGGTLGGVGTIEGLLAVEGDLGPGNSAGTLTVDGAVDVKENATVVIELGGIDLGSGYDSVDGNGTSSLSLDGMLDVSFINGFNALSTDDFFVLNNFATVSGRFNNTMADELVFDGGTFDVEYGSSFVRLYNFESAVAVPEPNCAVVLIIYAALVGRRRRRA
jgi:hypothetical protein